MENENQKNRRTDLVNLARSYWNNLHDFRNRRERHKRYAFGNQWADLIEVDGKQMTEEEYIRSEGATPLKNNFINRFLRNVVGVYRSQAKEPVCVARDRRESGMAETMSTVLQYNWQLNRMNELLAAVMKEFLISGAAIVRKSWGRRNGRTDCWTDIVNPRHFFVDSSCCDIRGWDVNAVGELRDFSFDELTGEFANGPEDIEHLRTVYRQRTEPSPPRFFGTEPHNDDFSSCGDPGRCRVIELWTRERYPRYICHDREKAVIFSVAPTDHAELVERPNRERRNQGHAEIEAVWNMEERWIYRCLAPDGTLLREMESPYCHGSHPYVFKFHPFIDGEVHSFLEDVIDQQRYVNRLVTLYDWTIRSAAKGALLFPENCLVNGMTLDDVTDEWSRYNGVIPIRANTESALPRQVNNTQGSQGIHDLLTTELRFFDDISGVNGALQGKPGLAGMSASLYSQQTHNATLSLLDMLEAFSDFVVDGAYKDVKNIQQFYPARRFDAISGEKLPQSDKPGRAAIAETEFDLSIAEMTSTAAYRQLANDYLTQLWRAGSISAEQMLRYGDFPFGRRLAEEISRSNGERQPDEADTDDME